MQSLITDMSQFIAILPLFTTKFTTYIKPMFKKYPLFIPFIPYFLSIVRMMCLYFAVWNGNIGIYILNAVCLALSSAGSYEEWKKQAQNDIKEPDLKPEIIKDNGNIHDFTSIQDIG